jgi:hypothetical protein
MLVRVRTRNILITPPLECECAGEGLAVSASLLSGGPAFLSPLYGGGYRRWRLQIGYRRIREQLILNIPIEIPMRKTRERVSEDVYGKTGALFLLIFPELIPERFDRNDGVFQ